MAEEPAEGGSTGSAEPQGASGGADPAAVALALNGASREDASAFLRKQSELAEIQKQHLHEHLGEQFKQLQLGTWEKRLGVLLRTLSAFGGANARFSSRLAVDLAGLHQFDAARAALEYPAAWRAGVKH